MHPQSNFLDVRLFHKKFGQPTDMPVGPGGTDGTKTEPPRLMNEEEFTFRRKFLFEEFDEYSVAFNKGNLVKAADALFDLQYVAFGTALYMRAGPLYFNPKGWPSFDYVRENGRSLGLLMDAPSVPRLLTQSAHEIVHELIGGQLEIFRLTHQSAEPNAVPFALAALWNVSYSVYLAAALMGVPWEDCWTVVQEKNMEKIRAQRDGSDSTRGTGLDVVKPIGWCAPDAEICRILIGAGATIPAEFVEEAAKTSRPKQ